MQKKHGVAHTTSVFETDCPPFHCHPTLPPNLAKRCLPMHANTWTLCNAKVKTCQHGTPAPTYKGLQKELCSTNNVEYKFWLFVYGIKNCVNDNIGSMQHPISSNMCPTNIDTSLSMKRCWQKRTPNSSCDIRKHCLLVVDFQRL